MKGNDSMSKAVAAMIFPDIKATYDCYEEMYPARTAASGAYTTRFGPSPTGFMHIGGLYTALINRIVAKRNGGAFYLRIEDTDQKRLLEGGVTEIINTLNEFEIKFDEGPSSETEDYGSYGPYRQSQRKQIYQAFAKYLLENDKAYPCFCSEIDVADIKNQQEVENCNLFGYYGKWARCRNLTDEEVLKKLSNGEEFIIRLKSEGKCGYFRDFNDGIRGTISLPENVFDTVLVKRDGYPTYHFAHVIDDHLMRTTDIIRADEWIASLPIHVQMFEMLGFEVPSYYHLSAIMKMDGSSKRKLSKRKDPEARVHFYIEIGYPSKAVIDYLLTICSADYETWRKEHPNEDIIHFPIDITKMGVSGALFDYNKLDSIAKNCVASMSDEEIYHTVSAWATKFNKKLDHYIYENNECFRKSIPVWHSRRLDVKKWSDLIECYPYIYDSSFDNCTCEVPENIKVKAEDVINILSDYLESFDSTDDANTWFSKIKTIAEKFNYAVKMGDYKKNSEGYNGSIVDVSSYIRFAITNKLDTPDLYQLIGIIGAGESANRIRRFINKLKVKSY
jgi:glutamyl-tRNA synthetase